MNRIYRIAEENNIPIVNVKMQKAEALSVTMGGSCIIAIDSRKVRSSADYKVKSVHELGHCITGAFYDETCPVTPRGRLERRANNWAIRTVATRKQVTDLIKNGSTELWQLAEGLGVTEEFMKDILKYYNLWNGD